MESCLSVERELDKVLTKFTGLHDHSVNTIEDFISAVENIRRELAEGTILKCFRIGFPIRLQDLKNIFPISCAQWQFIASTIGIYYKKV